MNDKVILGLFVAAFNIIIFMISIGYFGLVAKDKTKTLKSKILKIQFFIFIFQLIPIILKATMKQINNEVLIASFSRLLVVIISIFIYNIYIRVGEYLSIKNSLPGILILDKDKKTKKIELKYILIPAIILFIWNIIFYIIFINGSDMINDVQYNYNYAAELIDLFLITPIIEEIIFRHLFMNIFVDVFGKKRFVLILNIFITAAIFTCSHAGILQNDIIKFIQIFPLGLFLSYINIKKGLEYSILIHMLFNMSNIFIVLIV